MDAKVECNAPQCKHVFLLERVKNLNLENKDESDFLVAKVLLTRGGNKNNNEASEHSEMTRAREKIDSGLSEMRP